MKKFTYKKQMTDKEAKVVKLYVDTYNYCVGMANKSQNYIDAYYYTNKAEEMTRKVARSFGFFTVRGFYKWLDYNRSIKQKEES